ncbi:MAG: MBL fold metallo-hydrolase [Proteobacteria bacterium]|nr:MBL fold metallo-hydrolase [Pseudomonadota bacterium]
MKHITKISALASILLPFACATSNEKLSRAQSQNSGQMYVFESDSNGFNTKTFFYDNGQEVVAFDSQFTPDLAKQSIEFLRTKTKNPITNLVITHPNPDKFNAIDVFKSHGAEVIASKATAEAWPSVHAYKKYFFVNIAKMFTGDTYPKLSEVDQRFESSLELKLKNGEVISLRELKGPGVSSNQTVAYISAINSLIVGDLVHHKAHAWLEGGIVNGQPTPTIKSWIQDLEELKSRFATTNPMVYGGRGDAVDLKTAVDSQILYLSRVDEIVTKYVNGLGEQKAELKTEASQVHYTKLQQLIESEFADYKLGYMIQYGVYGLALSK